MLECCFIKTLKRKYIFYFSKRTGKSKNLSVSESQVFWEVLTLICFWKMLVGRCFWKTFDPRSPTVDPSNLGAYSCSQCAIQWGYTEGVCNAMFIAPEELVNLHPQHMQSGAQMTSAPSARPRTPATRPSQRCRCSGTAAAVRLEQFSAV